MQRSLSSVRIRETSEIRAVDIFTASSVKIGEAVKTRWQNSIDLVARLSDVPAVLVMRLDENEIEVFLSSRSPGNPYKESASDHLLEGLYCETVIGTGSILAVTDALKSHVWRANPDIKLNMIAYLGFPLTWPDGEIFGTVCLLDSKPGNFSAQTNDLMTALKQSLETDLRLMLSQFNLSESEQKYRLLNEEKDSFFSILSHDLRAPFTTLLGFSEILIDKISTGETESQLDIAKTLHNSASGVFSLLENLLDWSRLQRNNISFHPEEIDVSFLFRQVIGHLEFSIESKKLKLRNETGEKIKFKADPYMFSGIIRNLLSNAIKFTQRGGTITLRSSVSDRGLLIEVEDTGSGISQDRFAKLFTLDLRGTRGTEGEPSSGLGLIVVKEFVDKHGGTIAVTSDVGKGSRFTVKLPEN